MAVPSRSSHRKSAGVSQAIESSILSGRLHPGDRLPSEDELCATYSVSRTVIREAIHHLKARGILHSVKGSGSYVKEFGQEHLRLAFQLYSALATDERSFLELMDLRILVESDCTERLAKSGDPESLARVKARVDQMKAHQHDFKKFGEADIDFHLAIVESAGSNLYAAILGALLRNVGKRFARLTYIDKELVKLNLSEHLAIYQALARGDAPAAAAAMRRHLTGSRTRLVALLGQMT